MDLTSAQFWTGLGSIVLANILLSGDNAVVIAMAARGLPVHRQKQAIVFGSVAAIVLRVLLTLLAVHLLTLPWLKLAGGVALLYIGIELMRGDAHSPHAEPVPIGIAGAVRTILVADLVMSLDNVLAVAAAAQGNMALLVLGLVLSVPLIVFGSSLLLKVMERFPLIVTAGAALLGWLAGEMMAGDPAVSNLFGPLPGAAPVVASVAGALLVVVVGSALARRARRLAQAAGQPGPT